MNTRRRLVRLALAACAVSFAFAAQAVEITEDTTWSATEAAAYASEAISIAENVTLTVNLATDESATLGGVISGDGALKLTGNGGLVLNGANTFSGGLTIENPAATAYTYTGAFVSGGNAAAFGTGKVTVDSFLAKVWLDAEGTFVNAIDFKQVGHLAFGRTAKKSVKLSGAVTAACDVIIGGGTLTPGAGGTFEMTATATVTLPATCDVIIATRTYPTVKLYGKVTARALRSSSNSNPDHYSYNQLGFANGTLYLYNENDVDIVSAVATPFRFESGSSVKDRTEITDSYMRPDAGYRGGSTYYLDADLSAGSIPVWRLDSCPAIKPSVDWGKWYGTGSERTLTVVGGGRYVSQAQFMDSGNGKISLVWDPQGADAADSKLILSNRAHTTSGKITVKAGEVAVCGADATLSKLTAVDVKAGATFTLDTQVAQPLASLATLDAAGTFALGAGMANPFMEDITKLPAVAITGSGKLKVPAGATLKVGTVTVDGTAQAYTTYNKGNCDWIEGDGEVKSFNYIKMTKADIDAYTADTLDIGNGCVEFVLASGESATFAAKITGDGEVKVTGAGDLALAGANDYTGDTYLTADGAIVRAQDAAAFGTGKVHLDAKAHVFLEKDGATFPNAFDFSAIGHLTFQPAAAKAVMTLAGPITGTADVIVDTSYDVTQTQAQEGALDHLQNCQLIFDNTITIDKTVTFTGFLPSSCAIHFNKKITAAAVRGNNCSNGSTYGVPDGQLGSKCSGAGNCPVYFHAADNEIGRVIPYWNTYCLADGASLGANVTLTAADARNGSYHHAATMNLGNKSQSVYSIKQWDMTNYKIGASGAKLTCDSPLTLTVTGGGTYATDWKLVNALSLDWNPPNDGDTLIISNIAHTTSGKITVSKGTVFAVGATVSFKNLTALEVKAGATFKLSTDAASALAGIKTVMVEPGGVIEIMGGATPFGTTAKAAVNIGTNATATGTIKLADGVVAKFGIVRINGEAVANDTYTKSAAWIQGDGSAVVDSTALADNQWLHLKSGNWNVAENWSKRAVPSASYPTVVNVPGASYTVSLTDNAGTIGALSVENAAAGQTATLDVENAVVLGGVAKALDIGQGGIVNVGEGGSVDMLKGELSGSTVHIDIHDGGELKVDGGIVALTNYTGSAKVETGGKISISSGRLLTRNSVNGKRSYGSALTVEEGSEIRMTGGELHFTSLTWGGDGLVIKKGGTLDVSGDAIVGPIDNYMTDSRVFGDGEITFRGHSCFGRKSNVTGTGWGTGFAVGSGAVTGTVNFVDYAQFYDTGSSFKLDRGAGMVAQIILGSATNHTLCYSTYLGAGRGGRGELIITNGQFTTYGIGLRVAGAYERQDATAALYSDGLLRVAGQSRANIYSSNYATDSTLCGLVIGDDLIATTNGLGLSYGDVMRGYCEVADNGRVELGGSTCLLIGVGSTNALGRLTQTGGTIIDNNESDAYGKAVVGMGGGTGEWILEGGATLLKGDLYVGGALIVEDFHRTVWPQNGGRYYVGEAEHSGKAKGLVKVTGGTMEIRKNLILSKDGTGTVYLGANGSLTVGGNLDARAGSKLVVDMRGCTDLRRNLATFGGTTTAFDADNITVLADSEARYELRITDTGIRAVRPMGLIMMIK